MESAFTGRWLRIFPKSWRIPKRSNAQSPTWWITLPKHFRIHSSVRSTRDVVEITVADTGHGVTRELKERLFLPYFSTKKRGTGLGLAIVSRVVEEHHGSIRVEENQPVGARFIVELPVVSEIVIATANVQHA